MADAAAACDALDALRAAQQRLGGWQAVAAVAALGLLFPLFYAAAGWLLGAVLLVWAAHFGRKVYGAWHAWRAARQTRLERRLVQHAFSGEALRRCLHRDDHLWAGSLAFRGLRLMDTYPQQPARAAAARRQFRHALEPLHPPAPGVDAALAGALALATLGLGAASSSVLGAPALVALLVAEGVGWALRAPLHRPLRRLVWALSAWGAATMEAAAPPGRAYEHTPLYYARPWFGPAGGGGTAASGAARA